MRHLSEKELREAFYRASEIAEQQAHAVSLQDAQSPYESYLLAAEEAGISQQAMRQALRERFLVPPEVVRPGDVVFAPSADKAWYAASVLHIGSDSSVQLQFLRGGELHVALTDIRPLALVPGRKVQFEYDIIVAEMRGLWHEARLLEYDMVTREATITYGLTSYTVPLARLRLAVQKPAPSRPVRSLLIRTILIAGSIGGGIGVLLSHLLRR